MHQKDQAHQAHQADIIRLTTDLIGFASTEDNPQDIAAAMDYVYHYLQAIPGLYIHRSEHVGKPALMATLYDTHTPTYLLNGHIDVVPAHQEQFTAVVQGNRIYGRASLDMKGSVAVLLRLMRDLAAQDPRPDVGIQIVGDEEIGGEDGTKRLLQEGWTCRFFLSAEPTNLRICYEQKGIMWLNIRMKGDPTHGSRPWEGHNPIWELGNGLETLARRFPVPTSAAWCTTATPTGVQAGGKSVNQIPAQVILKLDIRYIPDDASDQVIEAIESCFPHASIDILKLAQPLATDSDNPYVKRLAQSLEQVQGSPAVLYREHFGSDARFYSEQDIPAVCFGPDGMGMHADEEWVDSDSLLQVYQVLRDFVSRESSA